MALMTPTSLPFVELCSGPVFPPTALSADLRTRPAILILFR